MSFEDGLAALNLQMPPRVPRTEYSAERHWDLVKAVTGLEVGPDSPPDVQQRASIAFMQAWNWDFYWNILLTNQEFGQLHTNMGHAAYTAEGVDKVAAGKAAFDDPDKVLAFDPMETFGRRDHRELVGRFERHYAQAVADMPFCLNMTGTYITLISGLIDLLGWDMLLLTAAVDADGFGRLCNRYAQWMQQYFDALADSNVPVVMVHDDIVWTSGPFIRPDWYRRYVFPNYKKFFDPLLQAGKKIVYTSDGNYTEFLDDVVAAGVHCVVMEPTTDMEYFAQRYGRTHAFVGNADTRILLSGSRDDIRAEVQRCMDIGKPCPGFFMAVGNHIPANTPVENAMYYNQVYQELGLR